MFLTAGLIITLTLISISNPVSLIFILITQTAWMACFIASSQSPPWMAYILFMVFLGGMLILFSYIASLASNEKYSVPKMLLSPTLIMFTLLLIPLNPQAPSKSMIKMFLLQKSSMMILMLAYLFIIMMSITNITLIKKGPLRSNLYTNFNWKSHPLIKIINNSLIDFPFPSSISYMWNFGSLLGLCLMIQVMTGLFLAMHYSGDTTMAFYSIIHMNRNVNMGWLLHFLHMNGASMFFICLYIYAGRNLYYSSFKLMETWNIGVMILLVTMMTALVGYVLPWGQMSYWGAFVITNLLSALPYVGPMLVQWIWGGFTVENPTLTRFFSLHFLMPFVIMVMALVHLIFLHQSGSNNPLGSKMEINKVQFHPFFTSKDSISFLTLMFLLVTVSSMAPFMLGDPENFNPANPLVTPIHIQPEWYFLFAYAILRSIPNKLGGVIALAASILILMILPLKQTMNIKPSGFFPFMKILFWTFLTTTFILTWIGKNPVEPPLVFVGQIFSVIYFLMFAIMSLSTSKH